MESSIGFPNSTESMTNTENSINTSPQTDLPSKIAWCSFEKNTIGVYDLQSEQMLGPFQGMQMAEGERTLLEYLKESKTLLSVHHSEINNEASFDILDTSKKYQKVYCHDIIKGKVGSGDIAKNSRRGITALIPIQNVAEYHLLDNTTLRILKKAKWNPLHKKWIESLSFNPEGSKIATIDYGGTIVLSDVDTSEFFFSTSMSVYHWFNKVRWNPIPEIQSIAFKFSKTSVAFLNSEKIVVDNREFGDGNNEDVFTVEWHPEGNLLAIAGERMAVMIYDTRAGSIVRNYRNHHTGWIWNLKWHHSGRYFATGSRDCSVKLFDFASEKTLYTLNTQDESKIVSFPS